MTYDEWLARRRYSVIRCHRGIEDDVWKKVEAFGLTWKEACDVAANLTKAEDAANPQATSWTRDLFEQRLETEPWTVDRTPKPKQMELFK